MPVMVPLPPKADRAAAEASWRKWAKDAFEKGPVEWSECLANAKRACPELHAFMVEEFKKLQEEKYGTAKANTSQGQKDASPAAKRAGKS